MCGSLRDRHANPFFTRAPKYRNVKKHFHSTTDWRNIKKKKKTGKKEQRHHSSCLATAPESHFGRAFFFFFRGKRCWKRIKVRSYAEYTYTLNGAERLIRRGKGCIAIDFFQCVRVSYVFKAYGIHIRFQSAARRHAEATAAQQQLVWEKDSCLV